MKTPRLNHKLELEDPRTFSDGSGGYIKSWQALGTLWAEISARSGRETILAGAPVSVVSYKIVVRAAPFGAPERPKPEQRFRAGAQYFLIQAVADDDADGRYITCYATQEAVV